MNTLDNIKERYNELQSRKSSRLSPIAQNAYEAFNRMGVPTAKHEEWKYTRVGNLFNKELELQPSDLHAEITLADVDAARLPGHEEANELVFVNGIFSPKLSVIRSAELVVQSLEHATESEYAPILQKHLGHSSRYAKDGIHALNSAFIHDGVFIHVGAGKITSHPVYIYYITDARSTNILSQPRSLIHIGENAQVEIAETHTSFGLSESFTNQVAEIVVEKDAMVSYYKIQNDNEHSNHVCTTHFRQTGKSYIHAVTISLNGGMVRNNLNIALEAEHAEAHLYGLYFLKGRSHVDNHTIVDHVKPNCMSNELYKGIISDTATAVFNGKIYVQPHAQKTNAYQSNKNILLSDGATVNTKPQLEIFADDVKCSHGCTVGRLDEEGLFYLRSRGISESIARSLLVHAFAIDILEHIKPAALREYVDQLIFERLEINAS